MIFACFLPVLTLFDFRLICSNKNFFDFIRTEFDGFCSNKSLQFFAVLIKILINRPKKL